MRSLEARLKRIENDRGRLKNNVYIYRVGNAADCHFSSEDKLNKELEKAKYKNAVVIRDLDNWV